MKVFHGAHTKFALHVGLCLTDDRDVAAVYATSRGVVQEMYLDMSDLSVVEIDGYDRDSDYAPGDNPGDDYAADILIYRDEDARGIQHKTWRIWSEKALAALTLIESDDEDEDDE